MPDTEIVKAKLAFQEQSPTHRFSIEVVPLGGEQRTSIEGYDFEDFNASLEALTTALRDTIKNIAPKKATIEFGVEIGLESGKLTALLVKGSGKANLKVTLEWS